VFGTAVAATVGKWIIQPEFSAVYVICRTNRSNCLGFNAWYFGLPSSSSHALIGGLIGSGLIARCIIQYVLVIIYLSGLL
jgi:PiT family inorganic phosphate transporter